MRSVKNRIYIVTYYIGDLRENDKRIEFYSDVVKNHFDIEVRKKAVTELENEVKTWNFYDVGDDPSFFVYRVLRNKQDGLSWGICRPDVRNSIQKEDLVMFFGVDDAKTNNRTNRVNYYYFVGYAMVEDKIKQEDIWVKPEYECYQQHCNLVIRRKEDNIVKYHEVIEEQYSHRKDWLWKISDNKIYFGNKIGFLEVTKKSFEKLSNTFCDWPISEIPVQTKSNYILFHNESDKIKILDEPRCIAKFKIGGNSPFEEWNKDDFSSALKKLIKVSNRHLRIDNQQPHRHIKITPKDGHEKFKRELDLLISSLE